MRTVCEKLYIFSRKTNFNNLFVKSVHYQSNLSLGKLYPSSNLSYTTPDEPARGNHEKFNGYIPVNDLHITYTKSSGPGGQNVNKVNTKVDVRFHLQSAKWLDNEVKEKLMEKLKSKITKDGYLIYKSDLTRSQHLNLADCLEKMRSNIYEVLTEKCELPIVNEEKFRRRMEKAAKERLIFKRHTSAVKNDRRGLVDV